MERRREELVCCAGKKGDFLVLLTQKAGREGGGGGVREERGGEKVVAEKVNSAVPPCASGVPVAGARQLQPCSRKMNWWGLLVSGRRDGVEEGIDGEAVGFSHPLDS